MKPVNCQMVIAISAGSAVDVWPIHGCANDPSPLLAAAVELAFRRQHRAEDRRHDRWGEHHRDENDHFVDDASRIRECKSTAKVRPRKVWTVKVTAKNTTVWRTAPQNSGSWKSWV